MISPRSIIFQNEPTNNDVGIGFFARIVAAKYTITNSKTTDSLGQPFSMAITQVYKIKFLVEMLV